MAPGRGGPADLVARPHLRRRGRSGAAGPPADGRARLLAARADPATAPPVASRRRFLIGGALAVGAVGLVAFLADSNSGGDRGASASPSAPPRRAGRRRSAPSASAGRATPPPRQVATGPLKFANWDAYIDQATEADAGDRRPTAGPSKTLVEFAAKYGVEVNYEKQDRRQRDVRGRRSRRQLDGGVPTGWDLIVLTDWMAGKIDRGGLGREDRSRPTCPTASPTCATRSGRALGPGHRLPLPVAVRDDRRRLQRQDLDQSRPDQDRRPVRSRVRRQGDAPHRGPRHVPADAPAQARAWHRRTRPRNDRRRRPGRPRLHAAVRGRAANRAFHGQRVPPGLRAAATPGRRWSGRATSPRRAARTTASSSPRKAR